MYGIPLYHWSERECIGNSNCFTQEIGVKLGAQVVFRYGGCISTAYSNLFTCEKLFGPESTLDPSVLLDLLADADDWIDKMGNDIRENFVQEMKLLFSKGKGTEEFIDGLFVLYEILGHNMEKAAPLKAPLAKLFGLIAAPDFSEGFMPYTQKISEAESEIFEALGQLDTKDPKIAAEIYSFLSNIYPPEAMEEIKISKTYKPVIENLPGLYKSMLSNKGNITQYIDVIFEILGEVNIKSAKKSATDVIATFRSVLKTSKDVDKYLDPILNTAPDFVEKFANGDLWSQAVTEWSVDILKEYSVPNSVTTSLSTAIINFVEMMTNSELEENYKDLIKWFPGFFYQLFPANKTEIDNAFNTLADGLQSLNYEDMASTRRSEETKMSEFIINLIHNIQPDMYSRSPGKKAISDAIIINLSKTFYNLMTEKYKDDLDTFFSTLISGFDAFPEIDAGKIIINLVTNLGEEVPADIKPFLNNLQDIVNSLVTDENAFEALGRITKMILDYKTAFPDSKFPEVARRYVENVNNTIKVQFDRHQCFENMNWSLSIDEQAAVYIKCSDKFHIKRKLNILKLMKTQYAIYTDLFFASFEAAGFDSDEKIQSIRAKNPGLATYLQLFRVLDPDDIKEILSDYSTWMVNLFDEHDNYDFNNFLYAINATTAKITSKLGSFMKDLRHVHAPDYCRYLSCGTETCNTHEAIEKIKPIQQAVLRGEKGKDSTSTINPAFTTDGAVVTGTTTSFLYLATLCLAKLFS